MDLIDQAVEAIKDEPKWTQEKLQQHLQQTKEMFYGKTVWEAVK